MARFAYTLLLTIPLLVAAAGPLCAAPVVSSATGDLLNRSTVTIRGLQFGVKDPAPPLKYDDFTSGKIGEALPEGSASNGWADGWHVYSHEAGYLPRYSLDQTRIPGDAVAHQEYREGNYNATIGLYNLEFQELYISGWTWCDPQGDPSENAKLINFGGDTGGSGSNYGYPQARTDQYPYNGSGHLYIAFSNNTYIQDWGLKGDLYPRQWNRIERYVNNGHYGESDGSTWIRRNLQDWAGVQGMFQGPGLDGPFRKFYIGHYYRLNGTAEMDRYWDELYVDTTLARIEIGDAPTWTACTHREIQIPVTWSDTQIAFQVNQGTFTAGQAAYLYVVDADGKPNAEGLPIVFGAGEDPGPPGTPGTPQRRP